MNARAKTLMVITFALGLIGQTQTSLAIPTGTITSLTEYVNSNQTQNFMAPGDDLLVNAVASVATAAGDPRILFSLNVKIVADFGQFEAANGTAVLEMGPGADGPTIFGESLHYTVPEGYYNHYDVIATLKYFDVGTAMFVELDSTW